MQKSHYSLLTISIALLLTQEAQPMLSRAAKRLIMPQITAATQKRSYNDLHNNTHAQRLAAMLTQGNQPTASRGHHHNQHQNLHPEVIVKKPRFHKTKMAGMLAAGIGIGAYGYKYLSEEFDEAVQEDLINMIKEEEFEELAKYNDSFAKHIVESSIFRAAVTQLFIKYLEEKQESHRSIDISLFPTNVLMSFLFASAGFRYIMVYNLLKFCTKSTDLEKLVGCLLQVYSYEQNITGAETLNRINSLNLIHKKCLELETLGKTISPEIKAFFQEIEEEVKAKIEQ